MMESNGEPSATDERILLARQNTFFSIPSVVKAKDGLSYQIGDLINSGGNAVVHECIETLQGNSFAIKFQVELRGVRRERFKQEVELLSALNDPHIITYVTDGSVAGTRSDRRQRERNWGRSQLPSRQEDIPFVILLRATESLADHVRARSSIPAANCLGQFLGLANALIKVNSVAIHRDIKPENVLVVGDAWAISDFGLCDVVNGGKDFSGDNERIGPIFWMSPEALNKQLGCGDAITQASDVFQLASVFWYAACGRHPSGIVEAQDWQGPSELFPVMQRALTHASTRRFATSAEFHSALSEAIGMN